MLVHVYVQCNKQMEQFRAHLALHALQSHSASRLKEEDSEADNSGVSTEHEGTSSPEVNNLKHFSSDQL